MVSDHLHALAIKNGVPLSAAFELTPCCNFACRMCYVRKTPAMLKEEGICLWSADEWIAAAEELKKQGMLCLLLTGGEPLLYPEFRRLYEALSGMGLIISINTNGSLLDDDMVEFFRHRPPSEFHITLYGSGEETYRKLCGVEGMYERVTSNIERAVAAGLYVDINLTVTPVNDPDIEGIVAWAKERGIAVRCTSYSFPPYRRGSDEGFIRNTPEAAASAQLRFVKAYADGDGYLRYLRSVAASESDPGFPDAECADMMLKDEYGRMKCRAGRSALWINYRGMMTACGMMETPSEKLAPGMSLSDAWSGIRRKIRDVRVAPECSKCGASAVCHACAAMAYAENGRTDEVPLYLCRMARAMKKKAEEELAGAGRMS